MDEGQVGQALGQVPEECPGRSVRLLGEQTDVVAQRQQSLEQRLGFLAASGCAFAHSSAS